MRGWQMLPFPHTQYCIRGERSISCVKKKRSEASEPQLDKQKNNASHFAATVTLASMSGSSIRELMTMT
jgi:hypothetical protein